MTASCLRSISHNPTSFGCPGFHSTLPVFVRVPVIEVGSVSQGEFEAAVGLLWSVGRAQTLVLSMIVDRNDEIRTFRPGAFFDLKTRYLNVVFLFSGAAKSLREAARTAPN